MCHELLAPARLGFCPGVLPAKLRSDWVSVRRGNCLSSARGYIQWPAVADRPDLGGRLRSRNGQLQVPRIGFDGPLSGCAHWAHGSWPVCRHEAKGISHLGKRQPLRRDSVAEKCLLTDRRPVALLRLSSRAIGESLNTLQDLFIEIALRLTSCRCAVYGSVLVLFEDAEDIGSLPVEELLLSCIGTVSRAEVLSCRILHAQ